MFFSNKSADTGKVNNKDDDDEEEEEVKMTRKTGTTAKKKKKNGDRKKYWHCTHKTFHKHFLGQLVLYLP
jgi:hypothetical protein